MLEYTLRVRDDLEIRWAVRIMTLRHSVYLYPEDRG